MSTTIPVPLWVILVFALLLLGHQWAMAIQTRNLRQLFEWYLDVQSRDARAAAEGS